MIQIKRANNGWILENHNEGEQDTHVFSENLATWIHDEDEWRAIAFKALLQEVLQIMGPEEGRYSKHRIFVEIRPGDKYES